MFSYGKQRFMGKVVSSPICHVSHSLKMQNGGDLALIPETQAPHPPSIKPLNLGGGGEKGGIVYRSLLLRHPKTCVHKMSLY